MGARVDIRATSNVDKADKADRIEQEWSRLLLGIVVRKRLDDDMTGGMCWTKKWRRVGMTQSEVRFHGDRGSSGASPFDPVNCCRNMHKRYEMRIVGCTLIHVPRMACPVPWELSRYCIFFFEDADVIGLRFPTNLGTS